MQGLTDLSDVPSAIDHLIELGLAAAFPVRAKADAYRVDGRKKLGATITAEGRATLSTLSQPTVAAAGKPTKAAQVVDLLARDAGATIAELTAATGWLPHTTRAALCGLRKKGHAIVTGKRDDVTCYSIGQAA
ncbi:DUF3489 domain-containing protein [Sphingomonas nostoxanthinifaciens]|nr:DUF3489 domain-containing protein [Sphingomonas nostoxanthinifaciens]